MNNVEQHLKALMNVISNMKAIEIVAFTGGISGGVIALFVPGGVVTGIMVWLSSAIIPALYTRIFRQVS